MIPSDEMGNHGAAEVTISIQSEDDQKQGPKAIKVIAKYPFGESLEMEQSRTVAAED